MDSKSRNWPLISSRRKSSERETGLIGVRQIQENERMDSVNAYGFLHWHWSNGFWRGPLLIGRAKCEWMNGSISGAVYFTEGPQLKRGNNPGSTPVETMELSVSI